MYCKFDLNAGIVKDMANKTASKSKRFVIFHQFIACCCCHLLFNYDFISSFLLLPWSSGVYCFCEMGEVSRKPLHLWLSSQPK